MEPPTPSHLPNFHPYPLPTFLAITLFLMWWSTSSSMQCLELKFLSKAKTGPNCCYARPHPAPSPPPNFHPYPPPYLPTLPLSHSPAPVPPPPVLTRGNRSLECVGSPRNALHRLSPRTVRLASLYFCKVVGMYRISHTSHILLIYWQMCCSVYWVLYALWRRYISQVHSGHLCVNFPAQIVFWERLL